jgi:hypothetical protein
MSNPLKNMTPEDAKAVHVLLAGIALHGLLTSKPPTQVAEGLVPEAFRVADAFMAEAMKRLL